MMNARLSLLLFLPALALAAPVRGNLALNIDQDSNELEGGDEDFDLGAEDATRILSFATMTLNELVRASSCKEDSTWDAGCTSITNTKGHVAGKNMESLVVELNGCTGGFENVKVTILEELSSGNLTMEKVDPLSVLPECAQKALANREKEVCASTLPRAVAPAQLRPVLNSARAPLSQFSVARVYELASQATDSHEPANEEEAAEFNKEALEDKDVNAFKPGKEEDKNGDDKGDDTRLGALNLAARMQARRSHSHRHYGARDSSRVFRSWAHRTSHVYATGDTSTDEDVRKTLANTVASEHEHVYAQSLPSAYSSTDGTPCWTGYQPRSQGSCGSCYAFGASTALALQSCVVRSRHGLDATNHPMFSAQGLVSCGSSRTPEGGSSSYTGGCDGGSGRMAFQYVIDHGLTTVGCWPYEQSAGNFANHFSTGGLSVRASPASHRLWTLLTSCSANAVAGGGMPLYVRAAVVADDYALHIWREWREPPLLQH